MEYLLLFISFLSVAGFTFYLGCRKKLSEFQKLDREIENDFIEEFGTYNLRSKKNIQYEKVTEWLEEQQKEAKLRNELS